MNSNWIALASSLGLLLSIYSYRVEINLESDSDYTAMCDVSEYVSCTKVFGSIYGKSFGLLPEDSMLNQPNGLYGILFYALMVPLSFYSSTKVLLFQLVSSLFACSLSVYLAYLLMFVLMDLCIVCVSLYGVNVTLLYWSIRRYQLARKRKVTAAAAAAAVDKKRE